MRTPLLLLLLTAALAACSSNKYYRVTTSHKTYYTRGDKVKMNQPTGYVTFEDIKSGRKIRVRTEDYMAREVSRSEAGVHAVDGAIYRGQETTWADDRLR